MPPQLESQSSRRVKYGANVLIASVAAVLLVLILNAIGYKRLINVRLDLTSTRRWSLSEQTETIVRNLDNDYRMVVLISEVSEFHQQAKDLIDEYGYLSDRLKIEQIDPTSENRLVKFYGELLKAYDTDVAPMRDAVEEGVDTLEAVRGEVKGHLELVRKVLDSSALSDERLKQFIQNVASTFAQMEQQAEQIDDNLEKATDSPLPDFAAAVSTVRGALTNYDEGVFQVVIERFSVAAESPTAPAAIKEQLLQIVEGIKATRQRMTSPIDKLKAVTTDNEYSKLRSQIGPETVVLMGPKGKPPSVIHLTEMFKEPDARELQQLEPGEQPERRFLGEEKITGALVAMELEKMPMVVFISAGQRPAIGYGGEYEHVAARLRALNFDVEQWSTSGRPGPMGQPMPPGPPPEPGEGQKALWIVTPVAPPNPMKPTMGPGDAGKIAEHVKTRMDKGDSAMIILATNPMAGFGMPDPIKQVTDQWSVTAEIDKLILHEVVGPRGRATPSAQLRIDQWSDEHPITKAIGSMPGIFVSASPLTIDTDPPDGTTVTPLVVATEKAMWAEKDLQKLQSGDVKLNPDTAGSRFYAGAAIEKDGKRLIVVTDPIWATDQITTYGQLGPGTAQLFGAIFPANAELFMNGAFWLLELDELIAAGARSQDIRRIEQMDRTSLIALRWALALILPGVCIAAGIGVWLVRRRV